MLYGCIHVQKLQGTFVDVNLLAAALVSEQSDARYEGEESVSSSYFLQLYLALQTAEDKVC